MSIPITAIKWENEKVVVLDQTLLPTTETYLEIDCVEALIQAISGLVVRGAPALGVAGAFGVVIAMDQRVRENWSESEFQENLHKLRNARPTAVNLAWAVDAISKLVALGRPTVLEAALTIAREDKESNTAMGIIGANWLITNVGERPMTLLTHCNAGSLASTGSGTALGVIRELHSRGLVTEVYADETRPLLQGSRLTAWELMKSEIPYRIQPDSAASMSILNGSIDAAIIGADRISRNGDTANKIGSLSVALACHVAQIPLLVVAPESTIDRNMDTGESIHIEIRADHEITHLKGVQIAPTGAKTFNPAFDVTPAKYISAVITELKAYEISKGETL